MSGNFPVLKINPPLQMVNLTPAIEVVESLEDSVVFRSSTIPSMEWRFLARTLRGAGGDCKAGGPGSLT